jgi:hypothetical protein
VTTDNRQQAADDDNQTDNRTITAIGMSRQQTADNRQRTAVQQTNRQQTSRQPDNRQQYSNTDSTVSVTSGTALMQYNTALNLGTTMVQLYGTI